MPAIGSSIGVSIASGLTGLRVDPHQSNNFVVEIEGLLLEVLGDFQITVPELGTIIASTRPFVVLTSNASRELSEALKRRCLFLHRDYPDQEREREIVLSQVPDLEATLAEDPAEDDDVPDDRVRGALSHGTTRRATRGRRPAARGSPRGT